MISNLKIAIKKQKKLITLFILTILLPSVILSIFGIRAIQNERFKIAQQYENEHERIANLLKQSISDRLNDVHTLLQNLATDPVFSQRNYEGIMNLIDKNHVPHKLIDQIIVIYKEENPIFPLFPPSTYVDTPILESFLDTGQRNKLKIAETNEYVHKNYPQTISLYNELFINVKNKSDQARMLNNIGRNFIKQNKFRQAIKIYDKIIYDYSAQKTSSNLPLSLIAYLQKVECYQLLGDFEEALKEAIYLYKKILQHNLRLNEDQFFTYADILKEKISDLLSSYSSSDTFHSEIERLDSLYFENYEQWKIIEKLRTICIPELQEKFIYYKPDSTKQIHYSKKIDQKNYLLEGELIPDKQKSAMRLLAVKFRNRYLESKFLTDVISSMRLDTTTMVKISDLSGNLLYGHNSHSDVFYNIIAFFDDNFLPWRIEIADTHAGEEDILAIHKSFYFWTILTLLIVLVFGLILIVKTVSHEMDILKIKSDFVSSVSHEFKTPLTSIQALTERLCEGKVKDPVKIREYFSVISQDANKLTRLVGNILNFSKIEEGKISYEFVETDLSHFLPEVITNFKNENLQKELKISTKVPMNISKIKIDKNAIAQAIYNLLDNAIKFSNDKKGIDVSVLQEKENVVIQVKDNGIGISKGELDKIFEKFYQSKNALQYSSRGTGLGLTLVKHTAEAHGGKISVQSQENQGSTFSLSLPISNNTV